MNRKINAPEITTQPFQRLHRLFGNCYLTDIDCVETTAGGLTDSWIGGEFTYENGREKVVAFIDYKHHDEKLVIESSALRAINNLADESNRYSLVVVNYLDTDHNPKMFYVIPFSTKSFKLFTQRGWNLKGEWCSIKGFCILLHTLRDLNWKREKERPIINSNAKPETVKQMTDFCIEFGIDPKGKLKDLPNQGTRDYILPIIDLPWLKTTNNELAPNSLKFPPETMSDRYDNCPF